MRKSKKTILSELKLHMEEGNIGLLQQNLNKVQSPVILDLLKDINTEEKATVFSLLDKELAYKTFKFLDYSTQKDLIKSLPYKQAAILLNGISTDDRTAFFEELPSAALNEFLRLLSTEERNITLTLLGYPESSVGRLMTPDYIAVKEDWTVKQVLDFVRENGKDTETINVIYVVDEKGILLDDIRIRAFLFVTPEKTVKELMDHNFLSLSPIDDQEVSVNIFRNNNRVALPVCDSFGVMLGIVTIDDVLRLAKEEDTEDIHKLGGLEALEEPYMNVSFFTLMKKRVGWLIVLFLGEMLTATAMGFFEDEISKAVVLALFVPLIISSGGNSGSQAATLIIRALAIGEVRISDWFRILKREIFSGVFLGFVLGLLGFLRIVVWSNFTNIYGEHSFRIASVVGLSLTGVVIWGTISGSMFPLLLKKAGFDPATSSAPFVATMVDVTGLVIYFSFALLILRGTVL
ncbi:MAG: magnesium transporter [Bacteroidetes bacterium RIFCSPLOWO2_12_FULL_37_12]|nr:MAG: magnesium transporter [Bacteroidetes bacterium RIFCSPLOWO2_12_FULL_37_12]